MNLIQYFGEDCKALAVTVGFGENLAPILASKKMARIGTLFLSDLNCIMALLSNDRAMRLIEWIQSAVSFSDESISNFLERSFEPR
jgi:hypothetical protein